MNLPPRKPHSIYAWLVGLPCGFLLMAITLAICGFTGYYCYWNYRAQKALDALAVEEEQKKQEVKQRAQAEYEAQQEERKRRLEADILAEKERVWREAEREREAAQEAEREREAVRAADLALEREKTRQAELAEQERKRQAAETEEARKRQAAEIEEARKQQALQAAIAEDHATIVAFIRRRITELRLYDLTWQGPFAASKNGQRGRSYRLDCTYVVLGKGRVRVTYQFFLVQEEVVDWIRGSEGRTWQEN
jgi:hypothetical protein